MNLSLSFSFNYFMNRRISANLKQYSVFPQRNWAILRDLGGLLSLTWQQEMLIITFLWEEKERSETQHTSMQPWKKLATAHGENVWDKLPLFIWITNDCTGAWGLKPCAERQRPTQSIPKHSLAANKPARTKHWATHYWRSQRNVPVSPDESSHSLLLNSAWKYLGLKQNWQHQDPSKHACWYLDFIFVDPSQLKLFCS